MTPLSDDALRRMQRAAEEPDLSGTKYRIVRRIGAGGMGVVYLAEDSELQRAVALKVIDAPDPSGARAARMIQEARIVARLEHPSIVPIHDVGTLPDGRVFYAMKHVEGRRLDDVARDESSLPRKLRTVQAICEAVAFAHARGVIHRDLKPENVMVGAFGEVVVLDWGVAKLRDAAEPPAADGRAPRSPHDTAPGTRVGTPAYMSPEQARGEIDRVDERADVYALGGILHFLLFGAPPAGAPRREPRLPRRLDAVRRKALEPDPAARYASAADLAADLARFLDGQAVAARREGPLETAVRFVDRHRTLAALVAAYLVMRVVVVLVSGR